MVGFSGHYGLEENVGIHVIISNLLWWVSVILMIITYRYRKIWNIGFAPWTYLFLSFLFFGIRELGHFSTSPVIDILRYLFGIWSAIFMVSTFVLIFMVLYKRKQITGIPSILPAVIAFFFLILMTYFFISSAGISKIKNIFSFLESLLWIIGSSMTIYITFMLATRASGGFIKVFMFFQFSAYAAFTWKFLGLIEKINGIMPYSIREVVETLFGAFAIISIYLLAKMLIKLSRNMHGNKI